MSRVELMTLRLMNYCCRALHVLSLIEILYPLFKCHVSLILAYDFDIIRIKPHNSAEMVIAECHCDTDNQYNYIDEQSHRTYVLFFIRCYYIVRSPRNCHYYS